MRKDIHVKINSSNGNQVDLNNTDIADNEIDEMMNALKESHPNLEHLYLMRNNISDQGAIILADKLSSFPKLSFLDLQFNKIDKKGAAAIISLKLQNPEMTIGLHGNKIYDAGEMDDIEKAVLGRRVD
jgi:Ran GTPase-activating protein (RanGAP) involved in mRNA processing and transport